MPAKKPKSVKFACNEYRTWTFDPSVTVESWEIQFGCNSGDDDETDYSYFRIYIDNGWIDFLDKRDNSTVKESLRDEGLVIDDKESMIKRLELIMGRKLQRIVEVPPSKDNPGYFYELYFYKKVLRLKFTVPIRILFVQFDDEE